LIRNIKTEGSPKSRYTKLFVNKKLKELEDSEKEYVVGIDYASIYSKDYTSVCYFTEDESGNLVLEGTKNISV
jgi:hypothetical protein